MYGPALCLMLCRPRWVKTGFHGASTPTRASISAAAFWHPTHAAPRARALSLSTARGKGPSAEACCGRRRAQFAARLSRIGDPSPAARFAAPLPLPQPSLLPSPPPGIIDPARSAPCTAPITAPVRACSSAHTGLPAPMNPRAPPQAAPHCRYLPVPAARRWRAAHLRRPAPPRRGARAGAEWRHVARGLKLFAEHPGIGIPLVSARLTCSLVPPRDVRGATLAGARPHRAAPSSPHARSARARARHSKPRAQPDPAAQALGGVPRLRRGCCAAASLPGSRLSAA
jgi:hypothetical protein